MHRIDTERRFEQNGITLLETAWRRDAHADRAVVEPTTAVFEFMRAGGFVRRALAGAREETHVDATRVALFNPGEEVAIDHPAGDANAGTTLRVDVEVLHEIAAERRRPLASVPFARASVPVPAALFVLQRRALGLARAAADPLAVEEALVRAIDGALDALAGSSPRAKEPSRFARRAVLRAQSVLVERFAQRLGLEEVAHASGLSRFQLCRAFAAITGRTIHDTLVELRLRHAVERIAGGEQNLTAVALDSGFASHAHLTDTFRARLGRAPSAMRRELRPRR